MAYNDLKNKIVGKWNQFSSSDLGKRIITRVKSFAWRYGIFLVITVLAYFVDNVLPNLNLNPEVIGLIAYVCNEITKDLNRKK